MKSRDSVIRLKRFHANEKRRQVTQIETMLAEFDRMARDLDDQIASEEQRTGISDVAHFAYSTFAKAAKQRRDNLTASVDELKAQLAAAVADQEEAIADLEKAEALAERDSAAEKGAGPVGGHRGLVAAAR